MRLGETSSDSLICLLRSACVRLVPTLKGPLASSASTTQVLWAAASASLTTIVVLRGESLKASSAALKVGGEK